MARTLGTDWLRKSTTPEERDSTTSMVRTAKPTLDVLLEIIKTRRQAIERSTEADYVNASWPYLQAHKNGRCQELDYIISLIDLNE